jgi:F-type H+-transporting ATPase subunit delta
MGILAVNVASRLALSVKEKTALRNKLEDQLNKKVTLDFLIDKKITGGIIIKYEDKTIDGSVEGMLSAFLESVA